MTLSMVVNGIMYLLAGLAESSRTNKHFFLNRLIRPGKKKDQQCHRVRIRPDQNLESILAY